MRFIFSFYFEDELNGHLEEPVPDPMEQRHMNIWMTAHFCNKQGMNVARVPPQSLQNLL